MTTYEINDKYRELLKFELTKEVIDLVFNVETLRSRFRNPEKIKRICELRLEKKTYTQIGNIVNLSSSMVRFHCNKVCIIYCLYMRGKMFDELKTAKLANIQKFTRDAKLHDVDVELLSKEISKLPIWGIENEEDRFTELLKWFYKEADE